MAEGAQRRPPGSLARSFGRLTTKAAVHAPWTWKLLRRPVRRVFDSLAPGWDERVGADSEARMAPLAAALEQVDAAPRRVLDIGTGTGSGALYLASRYPAAEVLGIDISEAMIAQAGEKARRRRSAARFELADITGFEPEEAFDLVLMMNMPAFFKQVAALVAPGGSVVTIASRGSTTPFYTPAKTLDRGFGRHGFETVASDPAGTFHVARRRAA